MASASANPKTGAGPEPDPKDKIEIANQLHRAETLQQGTHADESIALLEQIIPKNPIASLYVKLADWQIRQQAYGKAVPALRKALEMDPDENGARFMLAKSLLAMEDYKGAIPVLESLIAKVPDAVEAHSYLQLAYMEANRPADAIKECNIVLKYQPDDYGSYMILGKSLALTGDPDGGIATLKKAISMQPADPTPHEWLADIYDRVGKKPDADRERAEARQLKQQPQ